MRPWHAGYDRPWHAGYGARTSLRQASDPRNTNLVKCYTVAYEAEEVQVSHIIQAA